MKCLRVPFTVLVSTVNDTRLYAALMHALRGQSLHQRYGDDADYYVDGSVTYGPSQIRVFLTIASIDGRGIVLACYKNTFPSDTESTEIARVSADALWVRMSQAARERRNQYFT